MPNPSTTIDDRPPLARQVCQTCGRDAACHITLPQACAELHRLIRELALARAEILRLRVESEK